MPTIEIDACTLTQSPPLDPSMILHSGEAVDLRVLGTDSPPSRSCYATS